MIAPVQPHDQHGPDIPVQGSPPWFDPSWRDFHKLWSMRVAFVLMLLTGGEMAIPAFITWLPPRLFAFMCFSLVISGGVLRLLNQKSTSL